MHELGITEQLLSLALHHAEQAQATRVVHLNLVVGAFSSVLDESVQFYWDFMSRGTIAEGAVLNFQRVPGLLACQDCGVQFQLTEFDGQCPGCGGLRARIISGDDFRLDSIEIEEAKDGNNTSG
jgi:hydrogenase nickel incorporation protein HypA/HybF